MAWLNKQVKGSEFNNTHVNVLVVKNAQSTLLRAQTRLLFCRCWPENDHYTCGSIDSGLAVCFWKWKTLSLLSHPPAPPPLRSAAEDRGQIRSGNFCKIDTQKVGQRVRPHSLLYFMHNTWGKRPCHDAARRLFSAAPALSYPEQKCVQTQLYVVVYVFFNRAITWPFNLWIRSSPLTCDKSVCECVRVRVCACVCRLVRGWCGQKQTSGTEVKGDLVSLAGWGSSLQLHTDGRGAVWLLVSGVIYLVSCASLWPINDQQKWRMSHLISWLCRNLQLTVVVLWTFV